MKALILNTSKRTFINSSNQQMVGYTRTQIGLPKKQTENDIGYDITVITGKVECFNVIKRFVGKEVDIEVSYQKATDNSYKMKIAKINDIEF